MLTRLLRFALPAIAVLAAFALPSRAAEDRRCEANILGTEDAMLQWRSLYYPSGRYTRFTIGAGSGAFRARNDPDNAVYVIADRGPNFDCKQAAALIGDASRRPCTVNRKSRFYPTPDYSPSIYRLELDRENGAFAVKDAISLKTASGRAVSGLLNPQTAADTDYGVDLAGNPLPFDVDAVDAEALVKLSDGSFWVSEEMGPSLLHVAPDGRILQRFVPKNAAADYEGADTEIVASLPAILSQRARNRGIEALTVSPDEKYLYFMLQSPLANPDEAVYSTSRNVRLFKFDLASREIAGEYLYRLDDVAAFGLKPDAPEKSLRVSEIAALGENRFLVLERTDPRARFYEIEIGEAATDIHGSGWDDPLEAPSLEALEDPQSEGITPVAKTLRLDSDCIPGAPEKIEGMAFLGDGALMLINDNDFGIYGAETKVLVIENTVTPDPEVYRPRPVYRWL